jgi:hypothetical protein
MNVTVWLMVFYKDYSEDKNIKVNRPVALLSNAVILRSPWVLSAPISVILFITIL